MSCSSQDGCILQRGSVNLQKVQCRAQRWNDETTDKLNARTGADETLLYNKHSKKRHSLRSSTEDGITRKEASFPSALKSSRGSTSDVLGGSKTVAVKDFTCTKNEPSYDADKATASCDSHFNDVNTDAVLVKPQDKVCPIHPPFQLLVPGPTATSNPSVVLDEWTHGRLVWWNRFLANRKRSQGTLIGNYLGRTVDLESEWFPDRDMTSTRNHLKAVAASMGRRTLVMQSLGEMRYMIIPPRSLIAPFSNTPDQDPLLQGLRQCGSLTALRGLRRAEMISDIRNATGGRPNSLHEIQFLALCLDGSDGRVGNQQCTSEELKYLNSVTVWDILKTHDIKGRGVSSNCDIDPNSHSTQSLSPNLTGTSNVGLGERSKRRHGFSPAAYAKDNVTRQKSYVRNPVAKTLPSSSTTSSKDDVVYKSKNKWSQEDAEVLENSHEDREQDSLRRRRPRPTETSRVVLATESSGKTSLLRQRPSPDPLCLDNITNDRTPPEEKAPFLHSSLPLNLSQQDMYLTVRNIIRCICISYSDLVFLLGGIPFVLLDNRTGIDLPEEIPTYSFRVLEHVFSSSPYAPHIPPCLPRGHAIALHLFIANVFLHKLFRTIAVRVEYPSFTHPAIDSEKKFNSNVDNLTPSSDTLTKESKENFSMPTPQTCGNPSPSAPRYTLVFSLDHTHQTHEYLSAQTVALPHGELGNPFVTERCPYALKTPFPCASPPAALWSQSTRRSNEETNHVAKIASSAVLHDKSPTNSADCLNSEDSPNTKSTENHHATILPDFSICHYSTLHFIGLGPTTDDDPPSTSAENAVSLSASKADSQSVSDTSPDDEELDQAAQFAVESRDIRITLTSLKKRYETLQNLRAVAENIKLVYQKQVHQQHQAAKNDYSNENWQHFETLWTDIYRKLK